MVLKLPRFGASYLPVPNCVALISQNDDLKPFFATFTPVLINTQSEEVTRRKLLKAVFLMLM